MTTKQQATMSPRKLEELRMLADWQLLELGHVPAEITRLCAEADKRSAVLVEIDHALARFAQEDIEEWVEQR